MCPQQCVLVYQGLKIMKDKNIDFNIPMSSQCIDQFNWNFRIFLYFMNTLNSKEENV